MVRPSRSAGMVTTLSRDTTPGLFEPVVWPDRDLGIERFVDISRHST